MKRTRALALIVVLAVASLPGFAAATPVDVTIDSVEVSPSSPVPGDTVEITTTIANLQTSTAGFFVDKVAVLQDKDNDPDQYAKVLDVGTVPAGDTKRVPLTVSFDEAGTYDLRVQVIGRSTDTDEQTTVQYPVTLRVVDRSPQVDLDANDTAVGVQGDGSVTVANSLGAPIEDAELTVRGDGVTITNRREVLATLESGASRTVAFGYRPTESGTHTLNATLTYSTGPGTTRTVHETVTVEADPLEDRVTLDVSSVEGGSSQAVTVDVLNQGNAPLTNVTVRGRSANASVQRALVDRVAPGESRTVRLNATLSADRATVDVEAVYDVGAQRGSATATTTLTQTPGTIGLTGIEVVPDEGRLRISGSASNLGTTDAQSVLVSVVGTEQVTPAAPNKEFFVGTVPASDFVSFDVYATVDGNVSTVQLEVSYLVDGDRRTRTVAVDAAAASRALATQNAGRGEAGGGSGLLLPAAVVGVVALVVLGVVAYAWRNSRGGD